MFEEELNDMDALDQCDWDDVEGFFDIEGELRSALANLDECRDKYMKEVEKITFLMGLLDKGNNSIDEYETNIGEKIKRCSKLEEEVTILKKELKDAKDQISNGLSLNGGK